MKLHRFTSFEGLTLLFLFIELVTFCCYNLNRCFHPQAAGLLSRPGVSLLSDWRDLELPRVLHCPLKVFIVIPIDSLNSHQSAVQLFVAWSWSIKFIIQVWAVLPVLHHLFSPPCAGQQPFLVDIRCLWQNHIPDFSAGSRRKSMICTKRPGSMKNKLQDENK